MCKFYINLYKQILPRSYIFKSENVWEKGNTLFSFMLHVYIITMNAYSWGKRCTAMGLYFKVSSNTKTEAQK